MSESQQLIEAMDSRVKRRDERREFFRTAFGIGAAAVGGAAALGLATPAKAQAVTDPDILNFALNLEYLEANFYLFATTGSGLPASLTGGVTTGGAQGAATGGRQVSFADPVVAQYAREITADEVAHVTFLRTALGAAAIAQPAQDLGIDPAGAFSSAARAAGLVGPGVAFDPYLNDENFLLASFIFEDLGVTAYKGGAALISNKTFLEAAAGILAVEAYHAAIIRTLLYARGVDTPSLRSAADAISNARDSLDGSSDLDQGISPQTVTPTNLATPPGAVRASNIVPLDNNGIAFGRTVAQVHNIAYLTNTRRIGGGFFPAGTNNPNNELRFSGAN